MAKLSEGLDAEETESRLPGPTTSGLCSGDFSNDDRVSQLQTRVGKDRCCDRIGQCFDWENCF